ncbi:MAG: hypothetical protein ACPGVD_08055 [Flavobacteriales bacterium]
MHSEFYNELKKNLPNSNWDIRKNWAQEIVNQNIELQSLFPLLEENKKVASRFLWLLSDVADVSNSILFAELPYLLELSEKINHVDMKIAFTRFWQLTGVPEENESQAINMLFGYLNSSEIQVTQKSRALFVLFDLTKKYPGLENELKECLLIQRDKNTADFKRRADKILIKL